MKTGVIAVLICLPLASWMNSEDLVRRFGSPADTSSQAPAADDYVPPPPEREEFFSPSKNYRFTLSTPDRWKTRRSTAELFHKAPNGTAKSLWVRHLPHEWRPRYALVSDVGDVLLIDEWANIKSRFAVMIVNRDNRLVAQHDFDDVRDVLGLPVAQVVKLAKHGWWVVAPPRLGPTGRDATIETAGKILGIRLEDGHLSIAAGS